MWLEQNEIGVLIHATALPFTGSPVGYVRAGEPDASRSQPLVVRSISSIQTRFRFRFRRVVRSRGKHAAGGQGEEGSASAARLAIRHPDQQRRIDRGPAGAAVVRREMRGNSLRSRKRPIPRSRWLAGMWASRLKAQNSGACATSWRPIISMSAICVEGFDRNAAPRVQRNTEFFNRIGREPPSGRCPKEKPAEAGFP